MNSDVSIRVSQIWREMKSLKRMREEGENGDIRQELEDKFADIETEFGHESTLSKAIIYYLEENENSNTKL